MVETKKCIFCGGRLRKHGVRTYKAKSGEVKRTQDYECFECRRRSCHWVGQVMPERVIQAGVKPRDRRKQS